MIAKDALVYAQQGKRKTLQRKDLGKCCKERYLQIHWVTTYIVRQYILFHAVLVIAGERLSLTFLISLFSAALQTTQ